MLSRDEIYKKRLKDTIMHQSLYEFPQFLKDIRKSLGYSRKDVYEFANVTQARLFNMENGLFTKSPHMEYLVLLSKLYNVDLGLLKEKLEKYLMSRKHYHTYAQCVLSYLEKKG